ncbi:uncharacterized protein LOC134512644 isoform X4 [Chroicocephalus ridibundus]|uniref:uncharacterized protein LOC134512644 isoform X4 n=1 Tax=Chroicocephalus ridibundus TaxID=1192867 RepID=UPI002FDE000F
MCCGRKLLDSIHGSASGLCSWLCVWTQANGLISPEQIALLTWMNYYWRLDVSAQNCITSPPIIKILQIKYSSFLYPNGRQDGGTSLLGRRHRQQQPQLGLLLAPARSARPPSLLLLPSLSRTAAALATADGV